MYNIIFNQNSSSNNMYSRIYAYSPYTSTFDSYITTNGTTTLNSIPNSYSNSQTFNNISRYMYPHLDIVSVNNDTYIIFSASTMTDLVSFKLYYAYLPSGYVSTNFFTNTNNILTDETMFINHV